jgi:hypothetical protein
METALEVTDQQLVHLIATDPTQMQAAQADLQKFLRAKVTEIRSEVADVKHAHAVAVKNKWSHAVLKRQVERAQDNLVFYEKTLAAVDAGYCIIPNFPIDVFAVRIDKAAPRKIVRESTWSTSQASRAIPDEHGQALPGGEGRYVSENQIVETETLRDKDEKTGKETSTHLAWPVSFAKIVFPINAARPEIMDATARAMLLKVFDEIGICPQAPQADPLIIGRMAMKRRSGWQGPKMLSFLIAWHLDLRTL